MATALHTFVDIFNSSFDAGEDTVKLQKIVIPIIQRDYAQGRIDPDIERVRMRFLESLYKAATETPITLDFVYGDIDQNGIMTPLDGQQRLTTLFLLHWYAAKKEDVADAEYAFLHNFSYETRYSARDFCSFLVKYKPSFEQKLSEEIINQSWFPLDWKKDPTISSMLVMLDSIQTKFADCEGLWVALKSGAISFYFLPIKDMGLTDELYIKMNSRGKPLTLFEHFKAELEREIKLVDPTAAKRILKKIDIDWTDMLWQYRGDDNVIDDEFLRYFKFVCDIICYHNGGTPQGRSNDEFVLLKEYFSAQNEHALENINTLEAYFDCWYELSFSESPSEFINRFVSYTHESGKIQIETRYQIDIFHDCLTTYADSTGRRRTFPLNRIVLLYAITTYLLHRAAVSEEQFARRLRIVNNLIQNSEDEISDSEARASGNRMPAILAQVDSIIVDGGIDETIEKSLNPSQLSEEIAKLKWTSENPDKAESLYRLEDHPLLQGQISIIGLDNYAYFDAFEKLFRCDLDKIDCAFMATGFYPQREQNNWRYQFGSSSTRNTTAWRSLFHMSRNAGFEETRRILVELLSKCVEFTDNELERIADEYVVQCETDRLFTLRYYYIKYKTFRPGSYGKYSNDKYPQEQYVFSVMQTQSHWSENTYVPYLKEVDPLHLSRDHMGQRLTFTDSYLICENAAFVVRASEGDTEIERVTIAQNDDGIDIVDRVTVLRQYLQALGPNDGAAIE